MQYSYLRFPEGKFKAATFSYDDGNVCDLRLADVFTSYGLKCTFNLNRSSVTTRLTPDQVREHILSKGHEVAVHGNFHRAPGGVRAIEGIRDVLDCRLLLEQNFDTIIKGMAYPDYGITKFHNGASYSDIKSYLKQLDISYSRSLGGDNDSFLLPSDWHNWIPTAHHDNPKILEYLDKFLNTAILETTYLSQWFPRLFYVWGHAYEFDKKDNWDHIENICSKLSQKRDEIWFATNIEIYNYVKAYESLVYSADGSIVYNPTLYEIWFTADKTLYSIKSGETLRLTN